MAITESKLTTLAQLQLQAERVKQELELCEVRRAGRSGEEKPGQPDGPRHRAEGPG